MRLFVVGLSLIAGLIFIAMPVLAASPNGTWLRSETGGQFRAFNCGGGLGLKVTKSKTKSFVGQTIMCGAKQVAGKNQWRGSVKNLEDGNTYSGIVTLINAKTIQLEGCVLGGIICKSQTWSRVK
ncbi:MAG TPA: DUF2147 domain-containing protein [Hyphomicrobiaceae bacterium]|nr:DUF2147 domain-containing protein [Hyphomicrobiaceae bacterium]